MVEFKLDPWLSCHTPYPHLLIVFHLIPSASLQLCSVSASRFLSLESPQSCASPVVICFGLAPLDWPCALGCSVQLIPSLGCRLSLTLGLCAPPLNLTLWGFCLLLSGPALPGQLFTLRLPLTFPLVPSFPYRPVFSSRFQVIQLFPLCPQPSMGLGQDRL